MNGGGKIVMKKCCLCNTEFSANFNGACLVPNTEYRLCLKCAANVRILTHFHAKNQEEYENAFYELLKKLLVNKYPDQVTQELYNILKDISTYSEYCAMAQKAEH